MENLNSFKDVIPARLKWEMLQGWAETHKTKSLVAYPTSVEECREVIKYAQKRGLTICPRGSGYTFGDMTLNSNNIILNTSQMNQIISWDEKTGKIVIQPGVMFSDILAKGLADNWALNSCPGGLSVTIGGAISNNVHGKDSWKNGNFGDQVSNIKLLTSSGEVINVDRESNKDLFYAVVGGIGLLGVIIEATIQLEKVSSAFVEVSSIPVKNIEELIEVMEKSKSYCDFDVVWVDAFSSGSSLGRGIIDIGKWEDKEIELDPKKLTDSLNMPSRIFGILPAKPTWFLGRPFFIPPFIKILNSIQYNLKTVLGTPDNSKKDVVLFSDYNFVHNKIPELNNVFRPYGFVEFQPMIPRKSGVKSLTHILELCQRFKCQSLLCGIKSHKEDDYMISYSGDSYSISIDLQLRWRDRKQLNKFTRTLYEYVLECGGKTFLAKDELLPRDIFEQMYPRYKEFLRIKERVDSSELFVSDMYRRLLQPKN
ncbi:FAD-binding protein [candidate division KSB1 bacterium]